MDSWDRYWAGTLASAAHEEGGAQEAALNTFWDQCFRTIPQPRRLIDLAAGSGAVITQAAAYLKREAPGSAVGYWSVDRSPSAGQQLRDRLPQTQPVCADGARLPFPDRSFDWVLSQFGIEYAGSEAVLAAGRLVASGGAFAAVLHLKDGAIYRECAANLDASRQVEALELLPLGQAAFAARYALNAGRTTPDAFQRAERAFVPAVRGMEQLLKSVPDAGSGALLRQLYRDIAHMYPRVQQHDEAEVMQWFARMTIELKAYGERMQSMLEAALSTDELRSLDAALGATGLELKRSDQLLMGTKREPGAHGRIWLRPPG